MRLNKGGRGAEPMLQAMAQPMHLHQNRPGSVAKRQQEPFKGGRLSFRHHGKQHITVP